MLEIEIKYAGVDHAALESALSSWGTTPFEEQGEEDQYLAAPDRDFRVTGEAFRLRRVGNDAYLTYKGKRLPGEAKVRTELELPLPAGEEMPGQYLQLFIHLGYRPVAVVRKRRRQCSLTRDNFRINVCLDEVEELGRFAELEILAPQEQRDRAEQLLLETAAALGLKDIERRSYLSLLLAKRGEEA
jgi:adenylate cyclase, class 2